MRLIFGSLSGLVLLATLASACGGKEGSEVTPGADTGDGTGVGASGGILLGGSDGLGLGNGISGFGVSDVGGSARPRSAWWRAWW